jgi:hypothetical protein
MSHTCRQGQDKCADQGIPHGMNSKFQFASTRGAARLF